MGWYKKYTSDEGARLPVICAESKATTGASTSCTDIKVSPYKQSWCVSCPPHNTISSLHYRCEMFGRGKTCTKGAFIPPPQLLAAVSRSVTWLP